MTDDKTWIYDSVNWDELRASRWQKLDEALVAGGIDVVIGQRLENVRYITGISPFISLIYTPRYAAAYAAGHGPTLFTEQGDLKLNQRDAYWFDEIRTWPYRLIECAETAALYLDQLGLSTGAVVGYDDALSPALVELLNKRFPRNEWVDATEVIGRAKAIKGREEIKAIARAARVADIGVAAALAGVRVGVNERSIAAAAAAAMIDAGADALACHPQVSVDPLSRMPTGRELQVGDLLLVDLNPSVDGYLGDICRTFSVGVVSDRQRYVYKVQRQCLAAALTATRAGTAVAAVHDAVRAVVADAGLEHAWHGYITGHGVGTGSGPLEQPSIGTAPGIVDQLEEGMVIAYEPGIFEDGVGPVRVEEQVVVTADGHLQLTHGPYDPLLESSV